MLPALLPTRLLYKLRRAMVPRDYVTDFEKDEKGYIILAQVHDLLDGALLSELLAFA